MRKNLLITLTLISLSINCYSQSISVEYVSETEEFLKLDKDRMTSAILQIESNKPGWVSKDKYLLASVVLKMSKKYRVPVNVILAIAFVESSYTLNAVNKHSNDYGIMQVNQWHVKKSKLDKHKLLSNMSYSIEHGVRIFSWFYKTYPMDEAIMRYNAGTARNAVHYKGVKRYLRKVRNAM